MELVLRSTYNSVENPIGYWLGSKAFRVTIFIFGIVLVTGSVWLLMGSNELTTKSTFMTSLPEDITRTIQQLFHNVLERDKVQKLLLTLWTMPLNVGPDQLARSILILSNGQLEEIESIFTSNFYGDPRDIIVNAAIKNGNQAHYFNQPFPDN